MNKNAQDVMMGAPGPVENKQLEELHICIAEEEKNADAGVDA
jgi:aspartyl-tRNA synthetase